MTGSAPTRILFVCLGNICRSPLALAIFRDLAQKRGVGARFISDSCGTGHWHVGKGADPRSVLVAARYGIELIHTARRVDPARDFAEFDLLLGMDRANRETLLELGAPKGKVRLVREFDPALAAIKTHELDVPDPYYGGDDGFDHVYRMLTSACGGLLEQCVNDQK
jgi:protein-tyrosine phosphatase